jgi:hypothetical protein
MDKFLLTLFTTKMDSTLDEDSQVSGQLDTWLIWSGQRLGNALNNGDERTHF